MLDVRPEYDEAWSQFLNLLDDLAGDVARFVWRAVDCAECMASLRTLLPDVERAVLLLAQAYRDRFLPVIRQFAQDTMCLSQFRLLLNAVLSWFSMLQLPRPEHLLQSVLELVSDNYDFETIMVFGGRGDKQQPLPFVYRLNVSSQQWHRIGEMKTSRASAAACILDRTAVVIGGVAGDDAVLSSCSAVDMGTEREVPFDDVCAARFRACAVSHDGAIWLIGGLDGKTPATSVLCYTPNTRTWHEHKAKLPDTAVVLDGSAASMGSSILLAYTQDTRCFVTTLDTTAAQPCWSPAINFPCNRNASLFAHGWSRSVFVIGGLDESASDTQTASASVQRFHLDTKTVVALADIPHPRLQPAVTGSDRKLFVIGGQERKQDHRTVEEYNIARNEWQRLASIHVEGSLTCAAAVHLPLKIPTPDPTSKLQRKLETEQKRCCALKQQVIELNKRLESKSAEINKLRGDVISPGSFPDCCPSLTSVQMMISTS